MISKVLPLLRFAIGSVVVGAMSVIFSISFAAIVYTGPLAPFLDRGIGLTLLGAAIMSALGALLFSYRGNLAGPQDITAILLAGGTVHVASSALDGGAEAIFATAVAFIMIATLTSGIVATVLGAFRLSELSRYMPYPVLGGFLAATGLFLLLGGIGMVLGEQVAISDVPSLFVSERIFIWLPWLAAGAGMVALTRIVRSEYTLVAVIAVLSLAFYLVLAVSGVSLGEAKDAGLLLGPFPQAEFMSVERLPEFGLVRWHEFVGQSVVLGAVVGTTIVGGLLNLSGLELIIGRNFKLDRDLKTIGLTNIGSGLVGGLPGYPLISMVTIASRVGMTTAAAGIVVAVICGMTAFLGASFVGLLPIGLFASIIIYLGLELLITWLWREPRRLAAFDVSVIMVTLICAATVGLLQALAFGLVVAVVLFMLSYARNPVIRSVRSIYTHPSIVERDDKQLEFLATSGDAIRIFELTGYLFFGTAARIADRVTATSAKTVILDFSRVSGIDASAIQSLNRLRQDCSIGCIDVVLAGMGSEIEARFDLFNRDHENAASRFATLEDAVEAAEAELLSEMAEQGPPVNDAYFLAELKRLSPHIDPMKEFEVVTVVETTPIIRQREETTVMFVLLEGSARAEIELGDGQRLTVAKFLPGALIGEIAFYSEGPRTAHVIADAGTKLLLIEPKRIAALGALDAEFPANFHLTAARFLSRRLGRATRALRAAT